MFKASAELKTLVLKRPFRIATGVRVEQRNAFLTISDGTLAGMGEAALTGFEPDAPEKLIAEFARAQEIADRLGALQGLPPGEAVEKAVGPHCPPALQCAAEIAVCDLLGRKAGRPVWKLFGLKRGPIPISSFTLGIDRPEVMMEKLQEAAGLPILKIKLGSEHDEQVLPRLRKATDAVIRVDANGGWTPANAPERIKLCADNGVEFVEQPLPPGMITETARLAEKSPVPILVDEDCRTADDIPGLAGKVHGVNVKLRKSNGIWSALKTIKAARDKGLKVMIGCFVASSLSITAAAHLGSLAEWIDLDGHVLIGNDPFRGIKWEQGRIELPDLPGLGVAPA